MSRITSPRTSLSAVVCALLFTIVTVLPATAQVSVDLGAVNVNITYNGQPVGSLGGGCNFRTELSGPSGSFGLNLCDQGHYSNIPVGNYTLRLYHWGVYHAPLVSPIGIAVTAGVTETASFEVAGVVGFVTGTVTINSAPANTGGVCVSVGGGENCVGFGPGGTFKAIALGGTGTARVWGNGCQCITLGSMPVTAVAGQTENGGSLNISLGNAQVAITYNGTPVSSLNAGCNFRTELVSSNGSMGLNLCDQGTYSSIPAGSYTLRLYHWGVYGQPLVAPVAVTVVEGATASATFEVAGVMGVTTGTVLVNGHPHTGGGVCATVEGGQNCVGTNANGEFTVLTLAGAGSGFVWGNGCQCIVLGTFPIVVTAGSSASVGTIALGNGNARVSITYLGQPISTLNAGCNFRTELSSPTGSFGLNLCGEGDYTGVPAGTYTLKLYHWGVYDQTLVPPVLITITPGGTVSASFEVGAVMGIVTGFITINGLPANEGGVCGTVLGGQNCVGYGPGGTFRVLLRAGAGTGMVWNNGCQCHVIATFAFGVVAGTSTDIGNPLAPVPCAAGSYRATPSDPVCTPAPPGSFVDMVGAVASTLCAVGTYQPAAGSISCLPAPPGSFVSVAGAIASTLCPAGSYQPSAGATSCMPAPAGSFVSAVGATAPTPCAAGLTSGVGATFCVDNTPPTVTYTGNAGSYFVDQFVSIQCVATDASGIASTTCADISGPAWTFGAGRVSRGRREHLRAGLDVVRGRGYAVVAAGAGQRVRDRPRRRQRA
jgi:hypothetical protein